MSACYSLKSFSSLTILNTALFHSIGIPLSIEFCRTPLGQLSMKYFNSFVQAAIYRASSKPLSTVAKIGYGLPYKSFERKKAVANFVAAIPTDRKHENYALISELEQNVKNLS